MLKKECCMKCWNAYAEQRRTEYGRKFLRWVEDDELNWKEEYVLCPSDYLGKGEHVKREIKDEPPENCPFLIEQILNNQED